MPPSLIVSVFGSSRSQPGTPDYLLGVELGRLLAEAGYTVMNGGYTGTMEAVSKGAKEAGGRVIGVTAALFEERLGRRGPNGYVDEVIRYQTLRERVNHLVLECHAAVALPGGVGTLSEIMLTWSYLQVEDIRPIPLILIGDRWRRLMEQFYDPDQIDDRTMAMVRYSRTPQDAVSMLRDWHIHAR